MLKSGISKQVEVRDDISQLRILGIVVLVGDAPVPRKRAHCMGYVDKLSQGDWNVASGEVPMAENGEKSLDGSAFESRCKMSPDFDSKTSHCLYPSSLFKKKKKKKKY
jgi:hypothetical protein